MSQANLIIVTGPPGAGKSTLAARLADDLGVPFFSKDGIKESLFDTLGVQDRAWSMKLGHASIEVLFHALAWQLRAGQSTLAETAFIPTYDTPRFLKLRQEYACKMLQIYVTASPDVLFRRFHERANSGQRHAGHVDARANAQEFKQVLQSGKYAPLQLDAPIIEVETTDFDQLHYASILADVESHCAAA